MSASTGLYLSSYQTEDSLTKELKSDKAKPIHKKAQAYRDEFREGIVTLPEDIAIINMIYALLFFYRSFICLLNLIQLMRKLSQYKSIK